MPEASFTKHGEHIYYFKRIPTTDNLSGSDTSGQVSSMRSLLDDDMLLEIESELVLHRFDLKGFQED